MNAIVQTPPPSRSGAVDKHFGAKLREARTFRHLSQTELGDSLAVSYQQVQKYEDGTTRLTMAALYAISQVLHIKPEWFFEGLDAVNEGERPPLLDGFQRRLLETLDRISDDRTRRAIASFVETVAERMTAQVLTEAATHVLVEAGAR